MNKQLIGALSLLFLMLILAVVGWIYLVDNRIIQSQQVNHLKIKPKRSYIELNFEKENTKITFKNIPLTHIKVLSGEINVEVDKRNYPEEFTIDIMKLTGNYHIKYKSTEIVVYNGRFLINNKLMEDNKVIIDDKENFAWGHSVNYWEIPLSKVYNYLPTQNWL